MGTTLNGSMKAIFAAVLAFLGSLQTAMSGGSGVTGEEWVIIASATVAALALVYGVSNDENKVL